MSAVKVTRSAILDRVQVERLAPTARSSSSTSWGRAIAALVLAIATLTVPVRASAEGKRPVQDYGAPKDGSVEEVVLWAPRVVLFPLWLTSEFVLRRPIGALVKVAEREQWPQEVVDFFTFGDRRQVSVFPSALFDFGLLPSVGFNAKWKYFITDPNTVSLHFGTWGPDWIAARLTDTYDISASENVSFDTSFVRRQDNPFYALGPLSRGGTRYRYQSDLGEVAVAYQSRPWRSSSFDVRGGVRGLSLGQGRCCGDRSVDAGVESGAFPAPPGLGGSYVGGFQRVALAFDSRRPRPEQGSGVRLEVHGEGVFAPGNTETTRRSWMKYGGEGGAFLDVSGTQRVISLSAAVELADPLLGSVPFPELTTLGGDQPMRGYLRNRLIDRSSFVARMHYTWPIWVYLDGVIEVDVGNVFGARFEGFDAKLFRLSSGIGVRSSGARESGFEFLVAGATDPFDQGFHVSSFRFVLGSHHGF
jgi:Omp85 superfamily domain